MGQGQDSQHEEIHGQQEVDVLLGEYLRQKYKEKQEVRLAGGCEEPESWLLFWELAVPLQSWETCQKESLRALGAFQFLWRWGKKRGTSGCQMHLPKESVQGFDLGGFVTWRQTILCLCPESCMGIVGEGSLKFRVPRAPFEPQNTLSFKFPPLCSTEPPTAHQGPRHAGYKSSAPHST